MRNAVFAEYVEDVRDEFRFAIQVGPTAFAWWERIVFVGDECEIADAAVLFQVVDKAA